MAENFAKQEKWDDAVAAYRAALKKDPFDPELKQRLEHARQQAALRHAEAGKRALKDGRLSEALYEYKQALTLDPLKPDHHAAMADALRLKDAQDQLQAAQKLQGMGRLDEALDAYERAVEADPNLTKALEGITSVTEQQRAAKAVGSFGQPITLRFQNAKLKEVLEVLARTGGVNVLFDKDVKDDPVTIFIKDTPFDEALNLILALNGLFVKRLSGDTLLVIPNTKPKLDQYQDMMIRTFYLSNSKAKEMVNLIRTMLESKRVYVNEQINAIVVRDYPAKLQLAERLIVANDRRESEVELDLEVLEVNRSKSMKLGTSFAKVAAAGAFPPAFTGAVTDAATRFTFQEITSLGKGSYAFTLPTSFLLDFFKQEADAKTLASPKLRVLNTKQASVNIGEKQPILLSTTNVLPGQAATGAVPTTSTVTSIEFKDTGVKLTVEPIIHLVDEVTLKIKVEVTRIGDLVTLQANPEIKQFRFGTRTAETTLNMKDDETIVLAGLIQDEERKSRVTVPGIGDIPVLGHLFSSTQTDVITTEVVLTITPHIIRNLVTPTLEAQAFWSGTETAYATAPLFGAVPTHTSVNKPTVSESKPASEVKPAAAPAMVPPAPKPVDAAKPVPAPAAAPTPAPAVPPPAETVARGPGTFSLRPAEVAATMSQEFRLDITSPQPAAGESVMTITYDPNALEFRRAVPIRATIAATPGVGQVTLTVRTTAGALGTAGGDILASLLFSSKLKGDFPVVLSAGTKSGEGAEVSVTTERALIHVK